VLRPAARRAVVAGAQAATTRIIVQAKGTTVTDAMKEHATEKVAAAVSNFEIEVKEVDVHMEVRSKDKGQQGRTTHSCELVAYTHRNGQVRVEDAQDTMYAAIDTASHKLKGSLLKLKEKAMAKGKWPGHAEMKGATRLADAVAEDSESEASESEM